MSVFSMRAQDDPAAADEKLYQIKGQVINAADDKELSSVNVVNTTRVKGTITDKDGRFTMMAAINDTLYFSYLGFEPIEVRVTDDWTKYGEVTVSMTEKGIALEEVEVEGHNLTGFLEIDARKIPIYTNKRYSISGLETGYEAGSTSATAVNKLLGSLFNPADFLYGIFSKKGQDLRKVRKMKEDDEIRRLLQSKYDRETLVALLGIDGADIDGILRNCQYSKTFIETANDLQILDAISECYEEYKVLNRDRK